MKCMERAACVQNVPIYFVLQMLRFVMNSLNYSILKQAVLSSAPNVTNVFYLKRLNCVPENSME